MVTGLTDITRGLFGGGDEIDRILALPITQMRLALKHYYQDKEFSEQQFNDFIEKLSKVDDISSQIEVAKKAVNSRAVENELDIELNTPAKQLLWAAVLTRMMHTGTEPLARSMLWTQLQGTIGINNEEIGISRVIAKSLQNDGVTFNWGQPGSWFYYNPKTNKINIDIYYTLMMGFEHSRAAILHEVGHSELSNTYSKEMKELYEQVKVIIDPSSVAPDPKTGKRPRIKMKKEEKKALMLKVAEWQLRFKLWHMVEDTVVNQFSSNMRFQLSQHFGKSMNHIGATLQGFGELVLNADDGRDVSIVTDNAPTAKPERDVLDDKKKDEKPEDATQRRKQKADRSKTPLTDDEVTDIKSGHISVEIAKKMFEQISYGVLLNFYEQNGMFRGTDENWARFRILADDIRRTVDLKDVPGAAGKDAFEYLADLSSGRVNPPQVLMDVPMAKERALLWLDARAADAELLKVPANRRDALQYLSDKSKQKSISSAFRNLDASFDAPQVDDSIAETARAILARDGVLGADAAAKVADPLEELLKQVAAIPQKRADEARRILAQKDVMGATAAAASQDPVEDLFQMAARARGIRNLQPTPSDRLMVQEPYKTEGEGYRAAVAFTSEQRGRIMEHIWQLYLKPYADVILKAREEKIEKEMNQKPDKQQKGDKNDQQQQQKGGGSGQGESDDSGEQNDGGDSMPDTGDDDGDGNQQQQPQDDGIDVEDDDNDKNGEKNKDQKDGQGKDDTELSDEDMDDIGDMSKDPKEGHEKELNDKGDKPKDAKDAKSGKDGDGWKQDDKEPKQRKDKKVGDLKDKEPSNENLTPEEKEKLKQQAEAQRKADQQAFDMNQQGQQQDIDLSKLAKGNWTDFNQRVLELSPIINQKAAIYRRILAQQRMELRKQSTEQFTLRAEDGDLRGRLDQQRVRQKKLKKMTHQPLSLEDFKQIRADDAHYENSTVESMSLIDGSGSMPMKKLGNGVTAMDVALQSAVIDYMAARKAGVGSYIIMWGNDQPYVIAEPNTPLQEVGQRLEGVREGINSGTALSPAIVSSIETLANYVNTHGTISGSSHIMVYSDGEIQDFADAVKKLLSLTKQAKNLSVDVAVLVPKGSNPPPTEMEKAFKEVIKVNGDRMVGMLRGDDARTVPLEISRLTLARVKRFKVKLEDDKVKRARLKRIARSLKETG